MKYQYRTLALMVALASSGAQAESGADWSWSVETGLGYETNAYHAPDHAYIDYTPAVPVLVTPVEQDGFFVPLNADVQMRQGTSEQTTMQFDYKLRGRYFFDSALSDASSTKHDLGLGALRQLDEQSTLYGGVTFTRQDRVYVDHDSGEPKLSTGGTDVSNRYSYTGIGVRGEYERALGRNDLSVEAELEERDYSDPAVWSEYDHRYTHLGVGYRHHLARATSLKLSYDYKLRDYSDRHAYDATGTLLTSNPLLEYTYHDFGLSLRHRLSRQSVVYLDYDLGQRSDNFVGYNDRTTSRYGVRLIHKPAEQWRVRAKASYVDYDYDNAFNFDNPAQGIKSTTGTDLSLSVDYAQSEKRRYFLELEQKERDSSDDRYSYNDTTVMLGASWDF